MYHCHLRFCFMGHPCRAFKIIEGIAPLEHFTHEFSESEALKYIPSFKADVILVNLQGVDAKKALGALLEEMPEETELLVLAEKAQEELLEEELMRIKDLWILPMSDAAITFRFQRWQETSKMSKDYWQTSHYLETTINQVPNLIWYKTKEGIYKKVNDSFCRSANKTREQVEGQKYAYVWDVEEDDPIRMRSEQEVMTKEKTCVFEETLVTGDGSRLLTAYKSPLYDLNGDVMGIMGAAIDITQERAYEQEIMKKNRTLELILTTMDCGILCHTIDGSRIISVNDAALKILGYESEEALQANGFDMVAASVADEDKPRLRKCIRSLKKIGDSASIEYKVCHKNGEVRHVMGNIKLQEENGERFYQRFLLDCTKQKLKEKKHERHQMELLHALSIEYSFVWFFNLRNGKGSALRADGEDGVMFRLLFDKNRSFKESMARYINNFVCEEDREMLRRASEPKTLERELTEKKLYYVNYRVQKSNKVEYYQMKAVRAGEWEKNHWAVLGFRSVDEEIRNEMEQKDLLEDTLIQAKEASRAKSTFLSNMSHDIRTPLNAVIGFTGLALENEDPEMRREYLNNIMIASKNLLDLINSILEFSKIENQKLEMREELINIEDLYHKLIIISGVDLKEKGLTCTINLNIRHRYLYIDKNHYSQVFLNIINNAIKYTPKGGRIKISCRELPGELPGTCKIETVVRDNGIGMSEEFLSHAYDLFSRERTSTISGIQGTGLGLAIVKNLVDLMKGTVHIESQPGQWTRVTVCIPHRLGRYYEIAGVESSNGTDHSILENKRILLAEDIDINAMIATKMLSDKGCIVERARNGSECVDMVLKADAGYYDLVLMDIQMPVMDGYSAAQAIRAAEDVGKAAVPILAMTANVFQEDLDKAAAAGMNGHIAKPLDKAVMFQTIIETLYGLQ